jgi:hypothetical protein
MEDIERIIDFIKVEYSHGRISEQTANQLIVDLQNLINKNYIL